MLSRNHLSPPSMQHPAPRTFGSFTPVSSACGAAVAELCLKPSSSPLGMPLMHVQKTQLGLAPSDPPCLTALSTCPSLQTRLHGCPCVSSHPNSEDFSWNAVNDAVIALSRIPAPTCRHLAPPCSAWESLLPLLKHRKVRGLFSHP